MGQAEASYGGGNGVSGTRNTTAEFDPLLTCDRYIFPATYRARMGGILNADVSHWWLPNEEGLPVMLRSIRELINDRNSGRQHDQVQQDDIREMKGLFSNMSIDQTPSPPTQQSQSPGQPGVRPGRMEKGKGPEDETMTQDDALVWEDSPEYGWAFQS